MTPHICVSICTYKRPALLALLLAKLEEQYTGGAFTFSVVVADNDRTGSGEAAVAEARTRGRLAITYCIEPEQNIARARNAALRHACGDFLAFIDDDEVPDPCWLHTAWAHCERTGVEGVLGPVRPYFNHQPPRWLIDGRFCERPELPTGHRLAWRETRTGNVVMRRQKVADDPAPFAVGLGNGGEDQEFFRRLIADGSVFEWCAEAPVFELVTPERCTRRYLLKRALLRGQNERQLADFRGIAKSLVAVPLYSVVLPVALAAGQDHFMRYLIRLCDHAGKLLGVAGIKPMGSRYVS